jgi:hypothetical protein
MLHSSKDRAKPIGIDFIIDFLLRRGLPPRSWAAAADYVEILCSLDPPGQRDRTVFALMDRGGRASGR